MNIVIVTREEFPYGAAATNRMLTYLPGIASLGHTVTVLCLFLSQNRNLQLLDKNGECYYEGITIKYPSGNIQWPIGRNKLLTKTFLFVKARLNALYYIWKNRITTDIVQVYSSDVSLYYIFGKLCKWLQLPFLIERSELPDFVKEKEKFSKTREGRKYKQKCERAYAFFDGWILETQTLVDYYSQFFSTHAQKVVVPMTVEVDRFDIEKNPITKYGEYIAYCGNMAEYDGVSILIKAFNIFHKKYPNVKLILAGDSEDVPKQKQLAESLGIKKEVIFLGRVSRDEVPQLLADATILALASPTSDRACATMPCKVGEYLCTGNPVVVTGLGEINKYLKDGESAYLSAPDNEEAFAQKLEEVMSDMERAKVIGNKGKEVALQCFGSDAQVNRIEAFYKKVIESIKGND